MRPWTFEANNIDLRDVNTDNIYEYVVRTPAVEEFLICGSDDMKYFVVGPKGLGKTFLLKVKSKFYREHISGYQCLPEDELVEKLTSIRVSFSRDELSRLTRIETWEKTWELSLVTMILRNFGLELPAELKAIIGEARTLLDILSAFIRSRSAIDKLYAEHLPTSLRPKIGDLREHGTNQIAIFIDNIDEGIEKHGYSSTDGKGTLSEDVWINAQLGMMKVARDICQRNRHIKIFVSIRSEAFNKDTSPTALQTRNNATVLEYTRSQIQQIFQQNILATKRPSLAKPEASNLIERFVGFGEMSHRFAKDSLGQARKENTFDFIYRHTFGRPREIVLMGNKIAQVPVNERDGDQSVVRELVNFVSDELLQQLRQEMVPYFEEEVFNRFCELTRRNVVSIEQAKRISGQIQDETGFREDVFTYLYSIGLVGAAEYDWKQQQDVQKFLPVGQYSLSDHSPPKVSKYLVVHSSIDKVLRGKHGREFYDKNNIIGDGLSFQAPTVEESVEKPLHVHFGLGRDSRALIIPEISQDKAMMVIQKPSREEQELANVKFVELKTGAYEPIRFSVIHPNDKESRIRDAINGWRDGDNVIIYSVESELVGSVIDLCETITIWSGSFLATPDEELLPSLALDHISRDTRKKVVYLCQRVINKKIVSALKEQIKSKGLEERMSVRTLLIDRFEHERSKTKEDDTLVYEVKAEEYGSIICQERTGSANRNSDVILRTKNLKEQNYYEDREKYLTEGIYRLAKMIKTDTSVLEKPIEHLDQIYDLFFDIQIANLNTKHKLSGIYGNKTQDDIVTELKRLCLQQKERFSTIAQFPKFLDGHDNYVKDAKRIGAFPLDRTFFKLARLSRLFLKSEAALDLQRLLRVRPLSEYYSVFICFSVKDEVFAKKISDSLKKRGIDTYFFREDHRPGQIKSVEKKEIAERDKILFIASHNSITSVECQDELTLGVTQRQKRISGSAPASKVTDIFVPIAIDQYVFKAGETDLAKRLPKVHEALRNLQMIRQQSIVDFSQFREGEAVDRFEEKFDKEILPALLKEKRSRAKHV